MGSDLGLRGFVSSRGDGAWIGPESVTSEWKKGLVSFLPGRIDDSTPLTSQERV